MSPTVVVDPPVRGECAIFNPPGHPKLAFDFLAVDERRNPYRNASLLRHLFSRITVENTLAWGMPVYAARAGTVIVASDGTSDRLGLSMLRDLVNLLLFGPKVEPPFSNLGGNHVILDCGGVFPLYAHLRCGSVLVRPGQSVAAGEPLGVVGNSGSSLQPHLHFQVMSSPDPFPLFQNLLPLALSTVRRKKTGSGRLRSTTLRKMATTISWRKVRSNPSLKRSANGRPPGPVWRYAVHFRQPGPGVLPLSPA